MADPLWSSVAILCHLDNTDGTTVNLGSLGGAPGLTVGPDTTNQKFGVACADRRVTVFSVAPNPGIDTTGIAMSGDFVIEGWIRSDDIASLPRLISFNDEGDTDYSDHVLSVTAAGAVTLLREIYDLSTDDLISSVSDSSAAGVVVEGVYHHVVVQRTSGTLVTAIDGVSVISVADTRDYSGAFFVSWGSSAAAGFVDEIRLTTASRYTFPFTPPTAAFETDGGAGPTTTEGDGASAGVGTPAGIGATRGALTASSAGVAISSADILDATPSADGAATGTSDPRGYIANATQTGGWSQLNYWPPTMAWVLSADDKTATLAPTALYDEIRGVRGKSTGKWYFEISTSAVSSKGVGITQTGVALGSGAPPVRHSSGTVSTWGFAFDADTLEYWVRFDGAWNAGGPDALAPPDGTLLPGTQVPYADHSATLGANQIYVARFTAADLLHVPPAGFTPIDDEPGNAGAAAGTSAALGIGSVGSGGTGASAGSGDAAGSSVNGRVGTATSAASATVSADGIPATTRDGAAAGAAAVTGLVRSIAATEALSIGLSAGAGRMLFEIVGAAAGFGAASALAGGRTKFELGLTARSLVRRATATSPRQEIIANTPEASLT